MLEAHLDYLQIDAESMNHECGLRKANQHLLLMRAHEHDRGVGQVFSWYLPWYLRAREFTITPKSFFFVSQSQRSNDVRL